MAVTRNTAEQYPDGQPRKKQGWPSAFGTLCLYATPALQHRYRAGTSDTCNVMANNAETAAAKAKRAREIARLLREAYPESKIALDFGTPFQLLIATILAAQCTDVRVNMVTPALFAAFPTPQAFVDASQEEVEKAIFSTGFYRQKARSIKATSAALIERFGGEVPTTMEELLTLPGVGRKTANVLLGHCFDKPGMVVDTHVKRISNLLGLVDTDDPEKIEHELTKLLPPADWVIFSHLLADHGRAVCIARKPQCARCPISALCPSSTV